MFEPEYLIVQVLTDGKLFVVGNERLLDEFLKCDLEGAHHFFLIKKAYTVD